MAQSLRLFDAYSVACLGISLVHWGLTLQAKGSAELGQEKVEQGIRELTSAVVVVSRHTTTGDELTMPSPDGTVYDELAAMTLSSQAYDPFFLRGEREEAVFAVLASTGSRREMRKKRELTDRASHASGMANFALQ